MKVIFKDLNHDLIKLMPENLDDIWHLFNIISEGDLVRAVTYRTDEQKDDKIRSKKTEKKRMKLGIRVKEVKFHEFSDRLRIHGTIEEGPQDLGSFHTLNITADNMDKVSIIKKEWKHHHLERIDEAVKQRNQSILTFVSLDEDTATTDDDGEATGSLELDEVGYGFTIRATYEELGIYAETDEDSDEFRIVDEFTIFMDNFLLLLPYILIGLAALFTFITLRHRRLSKLRELWAGEALVLDDLVKISYIMVIHKDVGVTLYSKQIAMELDSDLIGGFITAISQFRSEIKKPIDELGTGAGFEMDYYDFKIDMADGKYIRTALILEGIPSEKLKQNQNMFTNSFETKFGPLLEDFTGDVQPFRETDTLIEKFFNLSLMYPLQLGPHWKFAKLKKLETALLEVAEQMQKERKYFFVSSLLNYGIAGRKESKDQIISAIIGLKRRGLLVPVENI